MKRGLSAGRVQSVAVRLVAEREAEIHAFMPEEYWTIDADVEGSDPAAVRRRVFKLDGQKAEMTNEGEAAGHRRPGPGRRAEGRLGREEGAPQEPAAAVHHLASCSRTPRASCASRPSAPWPWPSGCTKASSSVKRARSVSSPTCVPTRRACPTTPSPTCARYIAGRYGADRCRPSPTSTRPRRAPRTPTRRSGRRRRSFDPETVRQLMLATPGNRDAARDRGPGQAVHPDLEPLRRLPDDPGGVRPDGHRHRGRPGRPAGHRPGDQVRRLPRGLRRDGGGRRSPRTRAPATCPT